MPNKSVARRLVVPTLILTGAFMITAAPSYAGDHGGGGSKFRAVVCHDGETLTVLKKDLPAHLAHGDTKGPCKPPRTPCPTNTPAPTKTPEPTVTPSPEPSTPEPTETPQPMQEPTPEPTQEPTVQPSTQPPVTPHPPKQGRTTIGTPVTPGEKPAELAETGFDPSLLWAGLAGIGLVGGGFVLRARKAKP